METIQKKAEEGLTSEMALVQAAKKGDLEAFSELVKRYDRNVFRIAQHITHNEEDAQDVVQDAFLKAYQNLEQFQGNSKFNLLCSAAQLGLKAKYLFRTQ